MSAINPLEGWPNVVASMPRYWEAVTPHASNYLKGDASEYHVAIALIASADCTVTYRDAYQPSTSKDIALKAGVPFPGSFIRITAVSAGTVNAAFVTGADV